ncbi:MAG TPA: RidA family protein [Caldithrix sp.]|nr:RidA family protein [Calditrichaceae bacterium]HEM48951.1 RidA family protein [Caldithrix sp.]HES59032.1 RidA family protein [Caldithrix sp.]
MNLKCIKTKNAPEPIGPYSQAVESNNFIFTSGQIAIKPSTGQLLNGNVQEQTRLVLDNLKSVLSAAGSGMDQIVKTTIYLNNMDDFPQVNAVYSEYFTDSFPARSTVEVSRLPKNVLVEIDCIAAK